MRSPVALASSLRRIVTAVVVVVVCVGVLTAIAPRAVTRVAVAIQRRVSARSVDDRLREYESAVRTRLASDLARAGLAWPLRHVWLVAYKAERRLDVFVADAQRRPRFLRSYLVLGASGVEGPKLREGDRQVPEGLYRVDSLNPNSLYHLALHVDYPNADDRARATVEGRHDLGGEIMVHGGSGSIGCLAMGDEGVEDLFVLAARAGVGNTDIWIAPTDLLAHPRWTAPASAPAWATARYDALRAALSTLPRP
jgi:hypothetical protein